MSAHYTESFVEGDLWGYQCFTCGWEATGYETISAAEVAADEHSARVA